MEISDLSPEEIEAGLAVYVSSLASVLGGMDSTPYKQRTPKSLLANIRIAIEECISRTNLTAKSEELAKSIHDSVGSLYLEE